MEETKAERYATTDGETAAPGHENAGAPKPIDPRTGQHGAYWVLPDADLAAGFVRPVRESYQHDTCGTVTTMGRKIAETYARDPKFYGSTFCVGCRGHFPVGELGEFSWVDGSKVGT